MIRRTVPGERAWHFFIVSGRGFTVGFGGSWGFCRETRLQKSRRTRLTQVGPAIVVTGGYK